MKAIVLALSIPLAVSTIAAGFAATKSSTIPVSAKIVPGSTVSAFLIGGQVVTDVHEDGTRISTGQYGAPILRIGFETNRRWFFVKRVTWDKLHRKLTIDF
jgi:hypothetical protein